MRKTIVVLIIILVSLSGLIVFCACAYNSKPLEHERAFASVSVRRIASDADNDLNKSVEDIIDNLDDSSLNELLKDLSDEQSGIFGSRSFVDKLKQIVSGKDSTDYKSVLDYLLSVFLGNVGKILPFMLSIIGICAAFAIINSLKGNFASESITSVIRFACISIISVILFSQIFSLIRVTSSTVASISKQINIVFPIILTMMAATGSTGAVAAYTPAVAILGSALTGIITALALPCFILTVVFEIVGNLSDAVKLKKMSEFFFGALKWVLGTAFFVFLAFLSVKGITASIHDGISIRTAKFAISNYVPIIGTYLSEGFNMVMAGSVLIKNAVGLSAMILLLLTVAPLVGGIIVFSLSLSLLGAIVEPLGLEGVSTIMTGISKSLKSLTAIILGIAFLYFVFLLLTVATGNLVL